jgi:hypothetical protein
MILGCFEPNPHVSADGADTDEGGSTTEGTTTATTTAGTSGASTTVDSSTTTVDSTTTASTTSSVDEDSTATADDETTDADPVCDRRTHVCVEPPPAQWSGPVAIIEGAPGDPAPSCDAGFPEHELTAFDELSAPNPVCTCSCTAPANVTCTSATLIRAFFAGCFNPTDTYSNVSSCQNISGGSGLWLATGNVPNNLSCTPSFTSNVPNASFASRFTMCGGASSFGVCDGENESCVPKPAAETDGRVCIYATGDLMCPDNSAYTERSVYYDGFTDTRECTTCTCGAIVAQCSGTLMLANSPCGGQLGVNTTLSAGSCTNVTFDPASASSWNQTGSTASCPSSGGAPTGSAAPVDPVTVCCR